MKLIHETIPIPPALTVSREATTFRDGLLSESRAIVRVATAAEQNHAGVMARELRRHLNDVEGMRVELNAPLLAAQRLLMTLKNDHCRPLAEELDRIERLVTAFQEADRERVRQEEARRRAEIERLEAIEREAVRKAIEEQKRLNAERIAAEAAEAARLAAQPAATDEAAQATADLAAEQARAQADAEAAAKLAELEAAAQTAAAQARTAIVAPLPTVAKARGMATRQKLCWEVTDIRALYGAHPELCTLEPKASAINATCHPDHPVPGLRLWFETKTSTRAR